MGWTGWHGHVWGIETGGESVRSDGGVACIFMGFPGDFLAGFGAVVGAFTARAAEK